MSSERNNIRQFEEKKTKSMYEKLYFLFRSFSSLFFKRSIFLCFILFDHTVPSHTISISRYIHPFRSFRSLSRRQKTTLTLPSPTYRRHVNTRHAPRETISADTSITELQIDGKGLRQRDARKTYS